MDPEVQEAIDEQLGEGPKPTKIVVKRKTPVAKAAEMDPVLVEEMRAKLIEASKNEELEKSPAQLIRASPKVIEKLYNELETRNRRRRCEYIADFALTKTSKFLKNIGYIDRPDDLARDLKDDPLLKDDLIGLAGDYSHLIPYLGLITGGTTIAEHIYRSIPEAPREESLD